MPITRVRAVWPGALLVLSLAAMPVKAADQKKDAPAQMTVTKDPVTGKLRPATAEEAAALDQASKKTASKVPATAPKMIHGPGGAVGMVLDESSTIYAVAVKGPDHKVSTQEVTGQASATKAAKQTEARKTGDNNEK